MVAVVAVVEDAERAPRVRLGVVEIKVGLETGGLD